MGPPLLDSAIKILVLSAQSENKNFENLLSSFLNVMVALTVL